MVHQTAYNILYYIVLYCIYFTNWTKTNFLSHGELLYIIALPASCLARYQPSSLVISKTTHVLQGTCTADSSLISVYKPCLFYGAVYTLAEQGYTKVGGATLLTSYDSFLYFRLSGTLFPQHEWQN